MQCKPLAHFPQYTFFCFVRKNSFHRASLMLQRSEKKYNESKSNNNSISIAYSICAIDLSAIQKKNKRTTTQKQIKINGTGNTICNFHNLSHSMGSNNSQQKNHPIACCDRMNSILSFLRNHLIRLLFDTPNCIYTCIIHATEIENMCLEFCCIVFHPFDTISISFVQFAHIQTDSIIMNACAFTSHWRDRYFSNCEFFIRCPSTSLYSSFVVQIIYVCSVACCRQNKMESKTKSIRFRLVLQFSSTLRSFASLCIMFLIE